MTMLASRAAILAARLPHADVLVPELGEGVTVRVQQMSVGTRAAFMERIRLHRADLNAYEDDQDLPEEERQNLPKPPDLDVGVLSLVMSIVDEEGEFLFTEQNMDEFTTQSHNAVTRIYEAVLEINDYQRSNQDALSAEKKG